MRKKYLFLGLAAVSIFLYLFVSLDTKDTGEVHIIPTAGENITLIRTKQGNLLMGSGGSQADGRAVIQYLLQMNISRIEVLIWEGMDSPTTDVLPMLMEEIHIQSIYVPEAEMKEQSLESAFQKAKLLQIPVYGLLGNERWRLDKFLIETAMLPIDTASGQKIPIVKIEHPKLRMVVLPVEGVVPDVTLQQREVVRADILHVPGSLDRDFFGSLLPGQAGSKVLITGAIRGISSIAEIKIDQSLTLISTAEEGKIILYRRPEGFYITSEKKMNTRIQ